FVPAALIAARVYINRGETRKAQSLLRRVWRATSHPDVATLFANAVPGSSAVDRLKRIREIVDMPPPNRSSAIVLARAAIDAYDWQAAREALETYLVNPSQAVCTLMAEIEEGQNADQGKAREWLNRAMRAPRDPVWTADGITAEEWEPVSPVTGKLDAFEWRVPTSAVATRVAEPAVPRLPVRAEPLSGETLPPAPPAT
ncbi:MAG TPA: heme biosynthesis protein HemY, partial [Alphaproteobacteria bacterium]|nr:heme biosynthesis protein HemY [Alphaproteobacteria bacterium]